MFMNNLYSNITYLLLCKKSIGIVIITCSRTASSFPRPLALYSLLSMLDVELSVESLQGLQFLIRALASCSLLPMLNVEPSVESLQGLQFLLTALALHSLLSMLGVELSVESLQGLQFLLHILSTLKWI